MSDAQSNGTNDTPRESGASSVEEPITIGSFKISIRNGDLVVSSVSGHGVSVLVPGVLSKENLAVNLSRDGVRLKTDIG